MLGGQMYRHANNYTARLSRVAGSISLNTTAKPRNFEIFSNLSFFRALTNERIQSRY